nr:hypothetical protein [uncultured bacterium]
MGRLGAFNRDLFQGKLAAVTGSSGKTTVKELLAAILRQQGATLATQGNLNNDLGAPLTLLQLAAEHAYGVIEILANTVLGIGEDFKLFDINWFVFAIFIWLFFVIYHAFNVFITHRFMGKSWEQTQLNKLIALQQQRIEKLKTELKKEAPHIAQSEVYKESWNRTKKSK